MINNTEDIGRILVNNSKLNGFMREIYFSLRNAHIKDTNSMIDTYEDFKHHIYLQVLEKPERYYGKTENDALYMIYSIVHRQLYSVKSRFYYTYRKGKDLFNRDELPNIIDNGDEYMERISMDDIKDCLLDLDLPFYEKQFHLIIFWMRYEDKMSTEDISKHAGVGRKYILRSIRMVKEHLKNKLKEKWNIRFSE